MATADKRAGVYGSVIPFLHRLHQFAPALSNHDRAETRAQTSLFAGNSMTPALPVSSASMTLKVQVMR